MNFTYVHIKYFIGYVYHTCLQDTMQLSQLLCPLCQAMVLPMPLRPLLLTPRSSFMVAEAIFFRLCWALGIAESDRSAQPCMCPPYHQFSNCVRKIRQEKLRAIVVGPKWTHRKWWKPLMEITMQGYHLLGP